MNSLEKIADAMITESLDLMPHQVAERLRARIRDAASWDTVEVDVALVAMACKFLMPAGVGHKSDAEPDDTEIVDAFVEAFGGSHEQAIERLSRFAAMVKGAA